MYFYKNSLVEYDSLVHHEKQLLHKKYGNTIA